MPIYMNGRKIKDLYLGGRKIKEAWLNGVKVYSSHITFPWVFGDGFVGSAYEPYFKQVGTNFYGWGETDWLPVRANSAWNSITSTIVIGNCCGLDLTWYYYDNASTLKLAHLEDWGLGHGTDLRNIRFDYCHSLTEVFLGGTTAVWQIGNDFYVCESLTAIRGKSCVIKINNNISVTHAFYTNSALTRIEPILDMTDLGKVSFPVSGGDTDNLSVLRIKGWSNGDQDVYIGSVLPKWGIGSGEARQSFIDTLVNWSLPGRAGSIFHLSEEQYALLTVDDIVKIQGKGYDVMIG